jgi:hypothetical protein
LLQLLSLLTCGADVFGSMSALPLISDAMCDADDAAAGEDDRRTVSRQRRHPMR